MKSVPKCPALQRKLREKGAKGLGQRCLLGADQAILALCDYECRFRVDGTYLEVKVPDTPDVNLIIGALWKESLSAYMPFQNPIKPLNRLTRCD